MKIVIVGGGKIGTELATQLTREEHDVILIDNSRDAIRRIGNSLDMMFVYGNGGSLDVQRKAEVNESDLLIAVTSSDELNMIACMLARKLGCSNTIARVRNPEYSEQLYLLKDEMSLSMTVNPEWTAASEIFRLMQLPAFLKRTAFAKGRVEIVEVELRPEMSIANTCLNDVGKKLRVRMLVCAVQRGSSVFIPGGNFQLLAGDKIYAAVKTHDLTGLIRGIGLRSQKTRNALIIGGSRTAVYLATLLSQPGTSVKIMEKNKDRAVALAELLPRVTVLNEDGSERHILNSESMDQMDTVVTLTNMDEENLIISMYAKYMGVPQVITKINRTEFSEVFRDKGIDCVISPKLLCADRIISYVRAMQNTSGGSVLALHELVDETVEALEFSINKSCRHLKRMLMDLPLKKDVLIASISRANKIIIPSGTDFVQVHDTVIVVTTADRVIIDYNDIFLEDA